MSGSSISVKSTDAAAGKVVKLDGIFEADEAHAFAESTEEILVRYSRLSVGASALHFNEMMDIAEDRQAVAKILSAYVASAAYRAMWAYLDRPAKAAIPLHMCLLRTVDVANTPAHVPFHQDVAFMTDRFPSMNCWVALDDCGPGFGMPSLEVLAAPVDRRLDIVPEEQRQFVYHRNIELDLETLRTRYATEAFWHPDFRSGDGILFNQYAPHRTYIEPGMQEPAEAWRSGSAPRRSCSLSRPGFQTLRSAMTAVGMSWSWSTPPARVAC